MRPPVPARAALALLGALVLAGCGPTFQSVRRTATLGESLGGEAGALLGGPRICELLLGATARAAAAQAAAPALTPAPGASPPLAPLALASPPLACAEIGVVETARVMAGGARLLGAYARALGELAQDGSVSFGSLLDLVGNVKATAQAQRGGSLSVGSAGQKLSALMALGSASWRRKELARLILQADPQVSRIGRGLLLHLRLQREALSSLRGDGRGERGLLSNLRREIAAMGTLLRCQERDLTCRSLQRYGPLWSLELTMVAAWAEEQAQGLDRFERALSAFLAAHSILATHAADRGGAGLGDRDGRIEDEIRREIRQEIRRPILAPASAPASTPGPGAAPDANKDQAPPPRQGGEGARPAERD